MVSQISRSLPIALSIGQPLGSQAKAEAARTPQRAKFIAGNLVRNPESRSTRSGKLVVSFDIAVNEKLPDDKEYVSYFN